eukprot:TRINITY_DN807_c0_g1_i3.p1 TRINITY_DN807_c0_g1~~TRINITY_DN807_c0_g1_i3.p1  ORF type:complete len:322 (-),score=62.59 TRINITY_DN807_c0_g1_i3:127-1092(-)
MGMCLWANLHSRTQNGEVQGWSVETKKQMFKLDAERGVSVLNLQTARDKPWLFSQGKNGVVQCWDLGQSAPQFVSALQTQCGSFCRFSVPDCSAAALSAGSMLLAVPGASGNVVQIWDVHNQKVAQTINPEAYGPKRGLVMAVNMFTPPQAQSPMLTILCEDGHLTFWDISAAACLCDLPLHSDADTGLSMALYAPQYAFGVTGFAGSHLRYVQLDYDAGAVSASVTAELALPEDGPCGVSDVSIRQDGKLVITGGWDHRVRVFSTGRTPRPLAVLRLHTATVNAVDFCRPGAPAATVAGADQRLFVSASADKRVALWSLY